ERANDWRLVFRPTNHASNLRQSRIGPEELNHPEHGRGNARGGGAHQRRNSHQPTVTVTHDMAEELIVKKRSWATGKMLPPLGDPGRRGERCAGGDLTIELFPLRRHVG